MDHPWNNSMQERPSSLVRNFQQELEQKLQLQNELAGKMQMEGGGDLDWKRDFRASLFADSPEPMGGFKSFPSSGSMFNYSQKNFHISNGNLYSIFSPFQSRKSISKPSFLRGHVTPNESSLCERNPITIESGSSSLSGPGLRKCRSKLKFHHQNVPPQYRKSTKESDTSTNFQAFKSFSHNRSSTSSSFMKSQSIFSDSNDKQFFEDSEPFPTDDLLKEKTHKIDIDPFAALDLSSTSDKFFKTEFDSERPANRLRRSHARRSLFDDSEDEDEPLNLCIADQLKESKLSFFKKNEKVHHLQKNFFANRSPNTSIFRSPTIDFNQDTPEKSQSKREERLPHKEKDDEAMDLSFTTDGKRIGKNSSSKLFTRDTTSNEQEKVRKVPHISKMLENMSIWDDHSRSPNPSHDQLSNKDGNSSGWCQQFSPGWVDKSETNTSTTVTPEEKICADSKDETDKVKVFTQGLPTNYYVFIPSPFIQVVDKKEPPPHTITTSTNESEKLIIYVPPEEKTLPTPINPVKEDEKGFNQRIDDNINICKFKLVKGQQPSLEEKKNFFVPLPRSAKRPLEEQEKSSKAETGTKNDHFRTYKIHVGLQDDMGRKLAASRKVRRRSRKAIARDKLEATFREQGFLIKTQQVSSAEGSVYCKFRQLKKFTRYLFKSWKNYLPKDLEQMGGSKESGKPMVTLSMPDIPGTCKQMYSIPTARSASASTFDSASFASTVSEPPANETGGKLMVSNSMPLICPSSSTASVSPCPSVCSLTHTLSSSSVP